MSHHEGNLNILIIEDNEGDVVLLTHLIEDSTIPVENLYIAHRVDEGLEHLKNHTVDVVLLDLTLPDSTGLDSYFIIQQFNPTVPVIILTGIADTGMALDAINSGAQDFLMKGDFDAKVLSKVVLYSIERQRINESLRLSNERYNLVSKATNDMVWDWDLTTNKIFRNLEGWIKVFGDDAGADLRNADSWMERVHPDDVEYVNEVVNNALSSNSNNQFEIECRMRRNDGSYIYVVDRGYAIRNNEGKAVRLIGATQNINDKKLAEEELKRLSLIAKETLNIVIVTDAEGNITWVNEAFTNTTGYTKEEVLGRNPSLLQGPETSPVVKRYMRQKIANVQAFECDLINYKKNGEKYWVRIQSQPQFNESGVLANYFAIQTDITLEKEAEQNLINSERKFRTLIENSKDGLTLISADGVVQDLSIAGQKILGYSKEEYTGKDRLTLVHPDDRDLVSDAFLAILKDPKDIRIIEYRFKVSSGEYIWIESAYHNLLAEPTVGAVILHFREITDRKTAVDMLKGSEEKYRNLFNNIPSSIIIWDPADYSILEINEAAVNEYGYSREEFLKLKLTDLNPDGVGVQQVESLAAYFKNNPDFKSNSIWQHESKSKASRYMDITFQPFDYFGKKASLAIATNITEQIELEMELSSERLKKQQEITTAVITAQEQEREQLGKELHDNINQILATTRLYIEYSLTNEAMREQLMISAKGFIMSAVEEIRNLSKSLSPPSLGEIGLVVAIEELVESIRKINKFVFHVSLDDVDENELSEELKLTIFRIIQEQMNNIIKHAKAKNIWIKIKKQNQRLLISVKDDGKGFNLVAKNEGVGLKNISSRAGLHNGTMQMQSAPGEGCELKVSFSLL